MISEVTRQKMRVAKLGKIPWNKGLVGVQVAWNKGVPFSEESKRKMSVAHTENPQKYWLGKKRPDMSSMFSSLKRRTKGPNHWNWMGGITPINESIRKSPAYKAWRKSVFIRDGYLCVLGGKEHGSRLEADHIKPFALFPELRFDVSNGRTLCKACHKKTDTYGRRVPRYVTANSFNKWMLLASAQQS